MPGPRHRAHHRAASPASRVSRIVLVLLVVGAITVGTALVLRGGGDSGCSGEFVLSVETAPAVVAPVRAAAAEYQKAAPTADGRCVEVMVTARAAHETVRLLSGGWTEGATGPPPDVWIPDSATWLQLARLTEPGRRLLPEDGPTVATSPVVIAMPRPMAEAIGWPDKRLSWRDVATNEGSDTYWSERGDAGWGPFRVVFANPQASSASASAMLTIVAGAMGRPVNQLTADMFSGDLFTKKVILDLERASAAVPASDEVLLTELRQADADGRGMAYVSAVPMAESAVFAYNRGAPMDGKTTPPKEQLVAVQPADGITVQEVPYVALTATGNDPARAGAAAGFQRALLGEPGRAAFAAEGLRMPDGTNPALTVDAGFTPDLRSQPAGLAGPEATSAALEVFRGIHQRGTTLAVLDSSGSMTEIVPNSDGKTRLEVVVGAAKTAVPLFAGDSNLGLWQFSTTLDGDRDYRELVPIGPIDETVGGVLHRDALVTAMDSIEAEGDTGLYDTALAAFRALTASYTPGRPNQVVLMTDGKNDDPGSISLEELLTALKNEFDSSRPVHLITISYGEDADTEALEQISAATGSRSYPALDPNSIFQVIIDALTSR